MSVTLLPVEAVNCAFEAGSASGSDVAKWMSPSKNSLGELVTDLSDYKQKVDVTSIPDIWAGPKAFQAQLIDDIEVQRVAWRAVLAVIGLRKILRINLKVKTIDVPKVGDPVYNSKNTHPFLKVVARLMDKEFAGYPGGDAVNLITANNKTIAMVWPNSIIYPIPGAGVNVPWFDGQKYFDPAQSQSVSPEEAAVAEENGETIIPSSFLSEAQRSILARWLKKVRNKVAMSNISTSTEMSECLMAYIRDLGFNIEDIPDEENAEELIFSEGDKDFNIAGFGSLLSQVYTTPSSKEDLDLSNIRLDSLKGSDGKHILVIDEEIANQWKKQASNIICFGATDLGSALDMLHDPNKLRQFKEESKLSNYNTELWTADNFFTEKVAYITGFAEGANPFPNSLTETPEMRNKFFFDFGKNNMQEFILPIKREVLDYISPEDLVKNVVIERDNPTSVVKVYLNVELSGCDASGAKQVVTLSKVYEEADIVKRTTPPNVQIWPNFKADCWKQYYVFTGNSKTPSMNIDPAWSDDSKENLNFEVNAKEIKVKIRRGAEFPSVFVCNALDKNMNLPVGLICMNEGKLDTPRNSVERKTAYIGVDFGTTNSVVYYANNLGDDAFREQMHFEDRLFSVTRIREDNKDDLRRYFFPSNVQPEEVKGVSTNSIRTIFHDFNLVDKNQIENFEQPLTVGNIYYLEKGQNISDDLVVIDELKGNIKWDNKQEEDANEMRMHGFVHQLCLQAMAESVMRGAQNIIWQYSWPSSYDSDKSRNYATFWTTSLIEAMNEVAKISNSEEVYQKTESLSMADYFQKGVNEQDQGKAFSNGLLSIDIGGGSTDIAVWKGKDMQDKLRCLHQCSFKMAGTDIFAKYIINKYKKFSDLLNPLGANNRTLSKKFERLTELALEAKNNPPKWRTFELELESILKYSEKDIIQGMGVTSFSGKQYQELNTVMRDIAFALGGIFYYAGSIIGYFRRTYEDCPIDEKLPDCFVGGNGSKLLDWASKGEFDNTDKLKYFLRDCIVFGMIDSMRIKGNQLNGFGINTIIKQSEKPKHEVSFGLISGSGNKPSELEEDLFNEDNNSFGSGVDDYGSSSDGFDDDFSSSSHSFDDDFSGFGDGLAGLTGNVEAEANKHKNKVYPVVSGELFIVKGAQEPDDGMLTAENFTNPKKKVKVLFKNGNRFVRYCNVFNHEVEKYHLYNGKKIVFNNTKGVNDIVSLFDRVANDLEARTTNTNKGVVVEPIFIMELREALKKLSTY